MSSESETTCPALDCITQFTGRTLEVRRNVVTQLLQYNYKGLYNFASYMIDSSPLPVITISICLRLRYSGGSCEHAIKPSGSIKDGDFLD
jgi:hypothetical protein